MRNHAEESRVHEIPGEGYLGKGAAIVRHSPPWGLWGGSLRGPGSGRAVAVPERSRSRPGTPRAGAIKLGSSLCDNGSMSNATQRIESEMRAARGRSMMLFDDAAHEPTVAPVPVLTRVPHDTMPGLVLDRVAQYRLPVSRTEVAPR